MNNQNYKKAYDDDIRELRRIRENDQYLALKYVNNLINEIKNIDPIDEHRDFYKQCVSDLEKERDVLLENIDVKSAIKTRKDIIKDELYTRKKDEHLIKTYVDKKKDLIKLIKSDITNKEKKNISKDIKYAIIKIKTLRKQKQDQLQIIKDFKKEIIELNDLPNKKYGVTIHVFDVFGIYKNINLKVEKEN